MLEKPVFYIGSIPIFGRTILAPMAGISDHPYRSMTRQFGAAYAITEFINAMDVINRHPYLVSQRIAFSQGERPIAFQIFDDEPSRIIHTAQILSEFHPDIIDINLGCSVKHVSNRGAGAGLLRDPQKIARIFLELSKILTIPITAKIRLGWDHQHRNYLDIARIIEDNGGQLISVHARTRHQGYTGTADWDAIGEIKAQAGIPIVGNGDVKTVQDVDRLMAQTGCDAVMIGRAAIGNPWIFQCVSKSDLSILEIIETAVDHLKRMVSFYGEPLAYSLFRKHAGHYFDLSGLSSNQRRSFYQFDSIVTFKQNTLKFLMYPE